MIETEQIVDIDCDIQDVWTFARDIRNWASLMPGMQDCDIVDDDNSRWTLKVGVGGLVRTVKVKVHVDEWGGPERAVFSYRLDGDPVLGGGSYRATSNGPGKTAVVLHIRVEGSGPMAPMWEAMGRPLLPQLAKGFAEQFRDKIEAASGGAAGKIAAPKRRRSAIAAAMAWLGSLWHAVFGRTAASGPETEQVRQGQERTP